MTRTGPKSQGRNPVDNGEHSIGTGVLGIAKEKGRQCHSRSTEYLDLRWLFVTTQTMADRGLNTWK